MVATACNGVAEIISLDSNGLGDKVTNIAVKRVNVNEIVQVCID